MANSDESSGAREPRGELWVDRWILPALRDTSLLAPLVLVVAGHFVAFVAPMLIFAVRDQRIGAQMAVLGLLFLTFGACASRSADTAAPACSLDGSEEPGSRR